MTATPIEQRWDEYRRTRDQPARDRLIAHYHHLVRVIAQQVHRRLPSEIDVDDLASAGFFGLLDAIDAFEPERGVAFERYCALRIRGAIYDELRSLDWVPRLVRSRSARFERARIKLQSDLGRAVTDDELRQLFQDDRPELDRLARDRAPITMESLDLAQMDASLLETSPDCDRVIARECRRSGAEVNREELELLMDSELTATERLVVQLYYSERRTMSQIGFILGISESRISQIHTRIIQRLRTRMRMHTDEA